MKAPLNKNQAGCLRSLSLILISAGLLCACSPAAQPAPVQASLEPAEDTVPSQTQTPVDSDLPVTRQTASPPAPQPTSQPSGNTVCSPLAEIAPEELAGILTTPFDPPQPGLDDGHHGVDFSFWRHGDRKGMRGLPIQSILSGRVAGISVDSYPYGNMLIIETPLNDIEDFLYIEPTSTPLSTLDPRNVRLTCPPGSLENGSFTEQRSVYLLYAHLEQAPLAALGDSVGCGETLGGVGSTGASVNDHLHLEMRLGPQGATFPGMAHYTTDASQEEMAAYCTWRVSGRFEMLDPMLLFPGGE